MFFIESRHVGQPRKLIFFTCISYLTILILFIAIAYSANYPVKIKGKLIVDNNKLWKFYCDNHNYNLRNSSGNFIQDSASKLKINGIGFKIVKTSYVSDNRVELLLSPTDKSNRSKDIAFSIETGASFNIKVRIIKILFTSQ